MKRYVPRYAHIVCKYFKIEFFKLWTQNLFSGLGSGWDEVSKLLNFILTKYVRPDSQGASGYVRAAKTSLMHQLPIIFRFEIMQNHVYFLATYVQLYFDTAVGCG
jgi:hypothetical protein